jgi:hypothetical protein
MQIKQNHANQKLCSSRTFSPLRTACALAIVTSLAVLSGCGGGGPDDTSSPVKNTSDQPSKDPEPSEPVNTNLISKLFLADSPSGFYQFKKGGLWQRNSEANDPAGKYVDSIGMVRTYIDSSSGQMLTQNITPVIGSYAPARFDWGSTLIAEEGKAPNTVDNLMNTAPKVFGQTSTTVDIGPESFASPLYRVTFVPSDISGKPINSEATTDGVDSEPRNAGLPSALQADVSPMPNGSESYGFSYTVLRTHIVFSAGIIDDESTLESLQALNGGKIVSLGKVRYLENEANWSQSALCKTVNFEFDGGVMGGCLKEAGDVINNREKRGYNKIAADFVSNRLAQMFPDGVVNH